MNDSLETVIRIIELINQNNPKESNASIILAISTLIGVVGSIIVSLVNKQKIDQVKEQTNGNTTAMIDRLHNSVPVKPIDLNDNEKK